MKNNSKAGAKHVEIWIFFVDSILKYIWTSITEVLWSFENTDWENVARLPTFKFKGKKGLNFCPTEKPWDAESPQWLVTNALKKRPIVCSEVACTRHGKENPGHRLDPDSFKGKRFSVIFRVLAPDQRFPQWCVPGDLGGIDYFEVISRYREEGSRKDLKHSH
ncbi:hypothetical protein CEXT_696851 [Caerostris extrusa]|uniref:Uncharacterized protein n=1 Tax=Caerostris extrusa TaxID=172846 RepID=A0AAV4T4D0_CAEEX|nr:hypothetical protein CEXT_696851 [Caerostris extrusa]